MKELGFHKEYGDYVKRTDGLDCPGQGIECSKILVRTTHLDVIAEIYDGDALANTLKDMADQGLIDNSSM